MSKKTSILLFLCFIALGAMPLGLRAQIISTIAGGTIGDDSLATRAELIGPVGVTVDKNGNTYVVDAGSYRVRKIDATTGIITSIAGNGLYGYSGDGGAATSASMGIMYGVTVDQSGNVYVADISFSVVRKISTAGIITTIAGTGLTGYSGDGGAASAATLNNPSDIVADTAGNLYVADFMNAVVRKINTAGIITTVVGDGTVSGTTGSGGLATESELGAPFRVAMDRMGNLYVAEVQYQCICKIDTGGILTIIADTTGTYATGLCGDGSFGLSATMTSPCGLAVDTNNNLYFSDIGNFRIRKLDMTTGIINEYAASGIAGYSGDGLLATTSQIGSPEGLAIDLSGNLLICDPDNNRIRKVNQLGIMSTFAGQSGLFGDGPDATAEFCTPANVCTDASGNVYVADYYNNRIRKIDVSTGIVSTVVGTGIGGYMYGFNGDGELATLANIYNPTGIAMDAAGNLYIADNSNSRIRKVDATTGTISTIAGNGTASYGGDGGAATAAEMYGPAGVAVDTAGNVYIADQGNSRIRKVTPAGVISTVAGTGVAGFTGDGGPAVGAKISYPADVAVDNAGNLYIADADNSCIRKVNAAGIISSLTLSSTTGGGFSGDGGPSVSAKLSFPSGVKADAAGNVYICDGGNQRIRMINAAGIINTVAGNGVAGFSGDGGLATAAMLNGPAGVAVDNNGSMYIADGGNNRIRRVTDYLSVASTQVAGGSVQVYPNPAHSQVVVEVSSPLTGMEQLVLMNAVGQEVYHAPLLLNKQPIDISALATGIYMLQITNNSGEKKVVKVVKE